METSRRLIHPLMGATFVLSGLEALRDPKRPAPMKARPSASDVRRWSPPADAVVRATGAIQLMAGALLAAGRTRRVAAVALLGTVLPVTTGGHRFWEEEPCESRSVRRRILAKNLGLVAGLLLAALDTGGSPSLTWRARRRIEGSDLPATVHSVEGRVERVIPLTIWNRPADPAG